MRFGPWYPLDEAGAHAPAAEGVFQVRLADGLIDYPRGKSAMVYYGHAIDVRAAALAWSSGRARHALVCRHLIEIAGPDASDLRAFCANLRAEFVRRFGRAPLFETTE